jgi:sugar/nucleoside kinase (ribokinase family)
MPDPFALRAIDYLIIGHLAQDRTGEAVRLGGTAAYAAITASALGRRVGIVTSTSPDVDLELLSGIELVNSPAMSSTSFENRYERGRRHQKLNSLANPLGLEDIPAAWRRCALVHLAPIAGEVDPQLAQQFPQSFVGVTAQGWLREWDHEGIVRPSSFEAIEDVLDSADAVVVSIEDLDGDRHQAEAMAERCRLLAVTQGPQGTTVFHKGEARHMPVLAMNEVDPTGAGDVFAAAFFIQMSLTGDPWQSVDIANRIASITVAAEGASDLREMIAAFERERQAFG